MNDRVVQKRARMEFQQPEIHRTCSWATHAHVRRSICQPVDFLKLSLKHVHVLSRNRASSHHSHRAKYWYSHTVRPSVSMLSTRNGSL